jgi:glyoxylase-like metal-dependent hydrolase (beta-lactamase superfamily II)
LHILLGNTTNEKTDALLERNPVEASINAFLFQIADRLVLVDAGAGQFFGPGIGDQLVSSLGSVGVARGQITDVLLTHAHEDHMGGLVHGTKLTFPNATVHMSKADLDFFLDRENSKRTGYAISYFDQAFTALDPCLKAGKIKAFNYRRGLAWCDGLSCIQGTRREACSTGSRVKAKRSFSR